MVNEDINAVKLSAYFFACLFFAIGVLLFYLGFDRFVHYDQLASNIYQQTYSLLLFICYDLGTLVFLFLGFISLFIGHSSKISHLLRS